jgi:hypothetical protein
MVTVATTPSNAELKCPKCGYPLANLPTRTCPECGSAFEPAAVLKWHARHGCRRRWFISLAVMACVLYAPFSWLLWIEYPWSAYHWLWFRMWPILPGLPSTILLRSLGMRWPDWVEMIVMGLLTALLLLILTWLGSRGRWWLIITALIALALSCYNGWIGHILFNL